MSLHQRARLRSTSLLAVSGLAITGFAASGTADGQDPSAAESVIEVDVPASTTGAFDLSSLTVDPLPKNDGHEPVRSDLADVTAALADIEPYTVAYVGSDGEHIDATRLRDWLEGRNSPMAPYARELVAAGIEHDVDPRLVVGIAAMESSLGERLPPGSHNAWGWGGSGAHGLAAWPSWPVAIDAFTEGLARVYDTENVDTTMARKYVPPNWEKWLRTVRWVIDDI